MAYSHEQLMTISNIKNHGHRTWREARDHVKRLAARWGSRWVVFHVVLDGVEYWPVLGGRAVNNVGHALGWDLVTTAGGEG